ncbi:c-type cytochrome biogenesis protein CcmI [Falsigemmobacter intermedius]|uniref:C-type cytochrome biogenesis protein CcmI n=1 Tax=Falsigemmobacter intermedius TaxID=1553448 RepID=A0A451GHP2_9RHOB|nr:c-type cytochrome biogenesis protein CcmI [Falsigemmobacter intermedius]RWY38478.1 c-type cytochrome biogenesis protein CcmI [Falsigemmobacter intermedius]
MADILFWVITLALAFAVIGLMLAAAARGRDGATAASADLKVYKDQLRDVARDLERGLIAEEEAERLRTEIGRRILAADTTQRAAAGQSRRGPSQLVTLLSILPVILIAGYGVYYMKGHPELADQPMAQRLSAAAELRAARPSQAEAEAIAAAARGPLPEPADPRHAELVAQLRKAVEARPDDIDGQRLLARNEALLGNLGAAAAAQGRVNALMGERVSLSDLEAQADMMIMAAGGRVTPEAEEVLTRILSLDRSNGLARYYSGLSLAETGRYDLAFRFWAPLWVDSREGDPWVPFLQSQLPDLAWAAGQHRYELPALTPGTRGPDAAAIEAAADMTPEARMEMVRSMVDGLMTRLGAEGGSSEEWAQLIRSLGILGDEARGRAILLEARERFVARPDDLARINAAGKAAGFE